MAPVERDRNWDFGKLALNYELKFGEDLNSVKKKDNLWREKRCLHCHCIVKYYR